ncbi:hypothetical protein PybrP1_011354 [[Pythium] brassicae (nom. inval.)]|nr:hypothetical protein PybrP1_011354 [[Pythium] brassicae (nom. inval.)]
MGRAVILAQTALGSPRFESNTCKRTSATSTTKPIQKRRKCTSTIATGTSTTYQRSPGYFRTGPLSEKRKGQARSLRRTAACVQQLQNLRGRRTIPQARGQSFTNTKVEDGGELALARRARAPVRTDGDQTSTLQSLHHNKPKPIYAAPIELVWGAITNKIAQNPAQNMMELGTNIQAEVDRVTTKLWVGAFTKVQRIKKEYLKRLCDVSAEEQSEL